ncbi:hypothetical protein A3860_02440 [Niastella vici]|uniref:Uncharacterized protein n=1 Tax=Niastella vici TaxID=1703345 RepID=A0A1V9G9U9_9BACT|nr:hypothetical protein [Niastella vici]OQP67238.1 hypothetical protein A3860_02440 [Niastella vici]
MAALNRSNDYVKDVHSCLNTFYVLMGRKQVKKLEGMLSPNLRQFIRMESHREKFQKVFLFDREIVGYYIHQLTEINPGLLDAIILIGLEPVDEWGNASAAQKVKFKKQILDPDKLKYRFYRFRFINIHDHWFIDDVYQDNEFYCTASN